MLRVRRAHHEDVAGPDVEVVLSRDESHHVTRVLRLRPGDAVSVFDGRGREWEGILQSVHGGEARVRLGTEMTSAVDPTLEVVLFQGLCRPDRMEWVIQKATEIGVAAFRLMRTARVESAGRGADRLSRWRRIALEACKQCGRRRVPEVDVAGELPPRPRSGTLALLLTATARARPIGEALSEGRPPGVWLAVGPEGGFTAGEVAAWEARGWRSVELGPRTLRTETAGVVGATVVLHAWGDLGARPGLTNPQAGS